MNGFWSVLEMRGSQAPTCRENASMMLTNINGSDWISLVGGSLPTVGVQKF